MFISVLNFGGFGFSFRRNRLTFEKRALLSFNLDSLIVSSLAPIKRDHRHWLVRVTVWSESVQRSMLNFCLKKSGYTPSKSRETESD